MTQDSLIIAVCLMFSAFFSGMEIAFVSSNRIRLEIQKSQNSIVANILAKLTHNPSKFIVTMLVGNNIALVVYGIFMGKVIVHTLFPELVDSAELPMIGILYQTLISTGVILLTAEFLPKVFFQIYANGLLKFFSIPAYVFYRLLMPITTAVLWFSDGLLKRFFKVDTDQEPLAFSKGELEDYISEHIDSTKDQEIDSEIQIFQNALEFSNLKAREIMVPRAEIMAVDRYQTPKELIRLFSESGFSKILVYHQNLDNIIGYVHAFDLFKRPKTIRLITLPVEFVPESMFIKDVLNILTRKRKSISVVLDEYGGTAGMLTVEDIVEELFGEIEDEHDSLQLKEEQLNEHTYLFSARLDVDDINERYKLNLPESDQYETLGGLVVHNTAEIPDQNEQVVIEGFKFIIKEVSNTKIDLIELKVLI